MPPAEQSGVDLAGCRLRNPVIAASGTCGYGIECASILDPGSLGGLVMKSITPERRDGNPPWRIIESRRGMLNAIGLANCGLARFLEEKLPAARSLDTVLIGSIAGHTVDDYVEVAAAFDVEDALPIVELNISCPNTSDGTLFGLDAGSLRDLLSEVRPALDRTRLLVKLSPDAGNLVRMAEVAVEGGADGLTLINTFSAMAIHPSTRRPLLSRGTGGLSGPAIHPIAVRMVHEVYEAVARDAGIPIVGLGGIMEWEDAAEFILAGATAVGLGTALFVDPAIPAKVARGLTQWVTDQGATGITDLIGQVDLSQVPADPA